MTRIEIVTQLISAYLSQNTRSIEMEVLIEYMSKFADKIINDDLQHTKVVQ